MNGSAPLLAAANLVKAYPTGDWLTGRRSVRAVDGVSLAVHPGETLGLVGESGCGKSTLARCLLRLAEPTAGRIHFDGIDITHMSQRRLRPLRRYMQIVFQDPSASLNPRRRAGDLIAEPLRAHGRHSRAEIRDRLLELVRLVGLHPEHLDRYPHEFSGGQRQRIGIARALALSPRLIVADEPVSALDVSVQAQIVNLFMDLQERLGLAYLFISHDLRVVRQVSERIAVMYRGAIVETGPADAIFRAPAHPYTAALMRAVPQPGMKSWIIGAPPAPEPGEANGVAGGCRYRPRCAFAQGRCHAEAPGLHRLADGREVACHFSIAEPGARAAASAGGVRKGAPHAV
jgi:peptide/nickel transport system ATP-binding protein